MKQLSRALVALFLAILTVTLMPSQAFAATPDYISEIKIYEGNYDSAADEGYSILNGENGKPMDLNEDSGSDDIGAKGEQIVLKNQTAYYKAVQSNRKEGDSYYDDIDTCADMNGCVNPQWLALYAAKNEEQSPILANSLKAVAGSSEVPQGYETGIHMFGEKAAFNLNNKLYCWNQKAKSIMVYYKTDAAAASMDGSGFAAGKLALAGGVGLILGAVVTALGMTVAGKSKKNKASSAA